MRGLVDDKLKYADNTKLLEYAMMLMICLLRVVSFSVFASSL